MSNPNSVTGRTVTAATVQSDIASANNCHNTSKGKAAEAAAHALLAWRAAQGPKAPKTAKTWVEQAIAKRNQEIDQCNDEFRKANSKERLVRVDMKETAARFTKWVKFVFDFRLSSQASLVSRYSAVIEWADWKFKDKQIHSVSDITQMIDAAGGFEEVLALKRGEKKGSKGKLKPAANDNQALAGKVLDQIKASAVTSKPVTTYAATIEGVDKLVVSLGRSSDGKVDVISTVPLPTEGADHVLWLFEGDLGPKVPDTTAFLAQVLELADIIPEGQPTRHKEDNIAAGRLLKQERVLTLSVNSNAVTLGVSTRHADASVVLEAQPTSAHVQLGIPTQRMAMSTHDHAALIETLRGRSTRALVALSTNTDATGQLLSWTTTPAVGSANTYVWQPISSYTHKPLTPDGFVASVTIEIKADDISKLFYERLSAWAKKANSAPKANKGARTSKKLDRTKKAITLTFTQGELRYSMEADTDLVLPCTGAVASPVALRFRPGDLFVLAQKLKGLKATAFTMSADAGGMLRVSWSDSLGTYNIYQPTVNHNGHLETKRLTPMMPTPSPQLAA